MMNIVKLSYAHLASPDSKRLSNYYEETLGISHVETLEGKNYLSTGLDHHNIIISQENDSYLKTMGYQLDNSLSLKDVQKHLLKHQIKSEIQQDAIAGIPELLVTEDPEGYQIHLFNEMSFSKVGYKENGIHPHKLGHIALGAHDPNKMIAFYKDILNFKFTDFIGDKAAFLTCNQDHHTLNISNIKKSVMHHIAFELHDANHHVISSDRLAQRDIPVVWGPSRHTAGHNFASYHHDPDFNLIELYSDMDQYIAEFNYFDPRPWHKELPLRPKTWDHNCVWGTVYQPSILDSVMKKYDFAMED